MSKLDLSKEDQSVLREAVNREANRLTLARDNLLDTESDNALREAKAVHARIRVLERLYVALCVEEGAAQ